MAVKSQGTALAIESARASAKTITGITAANPPVVSSTGHGYANGDIVYIDGVVGMTQVNKRAFVVANQAASTFELKGIDGTSWSAYTSGGSAYKVTMTAVGEVSGLSGFDGQSSEIDVTNMLSVAKEYLTGLQDFGNMQFNMFLVTDTGQTALRSAKETQAAKVFTITLSNGAIAACVAFVKQLTFSADPDDAVKSQVALRITGAPAWFA